MAPPMWLSLRLRPYGISPRMMWTVNWLGRGYIKEDFMEVWRRYIPRAELDAWQNELKLKSAVDPAPVAQTPEP